MNRAIVSTTLGLVFLLAIATPAVAIEANSECLECHDLAAGGSVDFTVSAVDYTKCKTCHGLDPWWEHHHQQESCGQEGCHDGVDAFEFDNPPIAGKVSTPYGYFRTSTSWMAPPATLHEVHAEAGWVETTLGESGYGCSTCHASAACSSCHRDAVAHGPHALSEYPAVSYRQATGTSVTYAGSACVNEACHALNTAGTADFVPLCLSCHEADATAHYTAHDASASITTGCKKCHMPNLVDEHESRGLSCADCHRDAAYADAISSGLTQCDACHASPAHRQRGGR